MALCKHHEICDRDADEHTGDGLCILHSRNPEKDKEAFDRALVEHRDPKGPNKANKDNFSFFVFPRDADFEEITFDGGANFREACFFGMARFAGAKFKGVANFMLAEFHGHSCFGEAEFVQASFGHAQFKKRAWFWKARFGCSQNPGNTDFDRAQFDASADFREAQFHTRTIFESATFKGEAWFSNDACFWGETNFRYATFKDFTNFCDANFMGRANFQEARFLDDVEFREVLFKVDVSFYSVTFRNKVDFSEAIFDDKTSFEDARFHGRTLFLARKEKGWAEKVFSGVEVDFRWVTLEPPDVLEMRDADLGKCQFLGTDLRKAKFVGADWPKTSTEFVFYGDRSAAYDELLLKQESSASWKTPHVESLYRELKANYEDRRDFDRAGDFHYGEKEMRRCNKQETPWARRVLLWLYRWASAYGERCFPPFLWIVVLLLVSTAAYMCGDMLAPGKHTTWAGDPRNIWDVLLYSLRVMLLLKPDDFVCIGLWGKFINTVQSITGPLLIGLFGLAVRQRLKR